MKRQAAAKLLSASGLGWLLAKTQRPGGVLVLNYHRIGDGSSSPYDRELWSASAEGFDAQLAFLSRQCDVISPHEIEDAFSERSGRYALITFDDGYLDNFEIAYPILRARGVPATFFIATGFIDQPALPWWDEIAWLLRSTDHDRLALQPWFPSDFLLEADRSGVIGELLGKYKSLPSVEADLMLQALREQMDNQRPDRTPGLWMDWDMIREMDRNGMTIGGHTMHHPVLSRLTPEQQKTEIDGCAQRLLAETGKRMEYFAYPVGKPWAFDASTEASLESAGVRRAFSYYGGLAQSSSPRFDTPRVAVEPYIGLDDMKAMAWLPQVFCRPSTN